MSALPRPRSKLGARVSCAFLLSSVPTTTDVKSGRESITFEKVYEVCTWKFCEKRFES